VQSIAATTTRTGLTVRAELDTGAYPTGVKVSDAELNAVPVTGHAFHGECNYTVHPHPASPAGPTGPAPGSTAVFDRGALSCTNPSMSRACRSSSPGMLMPEAMVHSLYVRAASCRCSAHVLRGPGTFTRNGVRRRSR
jgi:hypothetical protein